MNFLLKLNLRLIFWAIIFGFISGIFGISLALIQIADYYLKEGTQQKTETFSFRISNSPNKLLNEDSILELQNVEGIAFVDPYFTPTNQITGTINYFGFTASTPVPVNGIPKRLGIEKAKRTHQADWNSTDLDTIAVLLPQQAITLYNNLAPQRGWPNLSEESFIGLPGITMNIDTNAIKVIISGFDPDEFGTIVSLSAEKLFSIYNNLGLEPSYDYFILETVPGLTAAQGRDVNKRIEALGYQTSRGREINFQQGLFIRIRYTLIIFGGSILLAFIVLLYYNISNSLRPLREKIMHYRIWAVKDPVIFPVCFFSLIFSSITGIISWIVCFFAVVPAQNYIIDSVSHIGINIPPLRDSVIISFETAIASSALFFLTNLFTTIYFYLTIPRSNSNNLSKKFSQN